MLLTDKRNSQSKPKDQAGPYTLHDVLTKDLSFLSGMSQLTTAPISRAYLLRESRPERAEMDGLATLIIKIGNSDVGLLVNDFRSNGGSFGVENSKRATHFLNYLSSRRIPAIYISNSSGVRLTDGRKVFQPAFGLLPALKKFSDKNLLITCAIGKCIGLGAVVFGYGHYRIAVRESGQINLTGPEVFKMFFGGGENFKEAASCERHFEQTSFVQELVDSKEEAILRIRNLLRYAKGVSDSVMTVENQGAGEGFDASLLNPSIAKMNELLAKVSDTHCEIFPDMSPVVRTYLVQKNGKVFGLFANPPGHPQNLISSAALTRFIAALEFFKRLELPIVSILDSPGGDPRVSETDKNFVSLYIKVINEIISYDQPKLGILAGRCFGGASVLGFPKIFGSEGVLAVENAQVGIIHSNIVDQLLSGVPRMALQWEEIKKEQRPDLKDLIEEGTIDRLITANQIQEEINLFLYEFAQSQHFRNLTSL